MQYLKNGQSFCMRNHADPSRPFVFFPVRYMEEVRNAPQDILSLPLYTEKVGLPYLIRRGCLQVTVRVPMHALFHREVLTVFSQASILNYVNGPAITEEVQHAARLNLNRALNNLVGPIQEQCFLAAEHKMPECPGAPHDSTMIHYIISHVLFS